VLYRLVLLLILFRIINLLAVPGFVPAFAGGTTFGGIIIYVIFFIENIDNKFKKQKSLYFKIIN